MLFYFENKILVPGVVLTSDHSVLNYIVKLVMDGSCLHRHTTVLPASSCYRLFIYGLNFSFTTTELCRAFLTLMDLICLVNRDGFEAEISK